MPFSLVPDISVDKITQLSVQEFLHRGISLVMMDLDNTLATYAGEGPSDELRKWKYKIEKAGIQLFILSNTKTDRPQKFSEDLGVRSVNRAKKPFGTVAKQVMESYGRTPQQTAIIGDQIFTDVLCANWNGFTSIVVKPIKLSNVLRALRYCLELPIRALCHTTIKGEK